MSYKSIQRSSFIFVILLLLILALAGCGVEKIAREQDQLVITDSANIEVQIPANIQSIADSWPAHNEVVTMLGAGDKIKATVDIKRAKSWLYTVNPAMKDARFVFTPNDVNIEELMKTKPDIVFISTNTATASKLKNIGIPVVQLFFTDFTGLKECFRITGSILGPEGKAKADAYIAYLDEKMAKIKAVTNSIPREQRPKVLHIHSWNPLLIDGTNTIIDSWIEVAGGTNAAVDVDGNMKPVTIEQVMAWDPDIIIASSNALPINLDGTRDIHTIIDNPVWQGIKAVRNNKVYANPEGAFFWDRYGAEEALQIQWAAKVLYPEQFQDIDIVKETRYFYKEFMNYDLSEAEANLIISGKNPE